MSDEKFYLEIDDTFDFGKEPMPLVTERDKEIYERILKETKQLMKEGAFDKENV